MRIHIIFCLSPDLIHVSHQVCGELSAFVHHLYLVSLEDERVVVAAPLAPVESENGSRSVPPDLGRVPLTVVNVDGSQPDLHLFSPERVEVVPEPKQVWSNYPLFTCSHWTICT